MSTIIPMDAPIARSVGLFELIRHLHRGNFDLLRDSGLTPQQLDQLRSIALEDLDALVSDKDLRVGIHVESASLDQCLTRLRRNKARRTALEYFVRHGASPKLMHQLFRMSQGDVSAYRQLLQVDVQPGRPALPSADLRMDIEAAWASSDLDDLRDRLVELHQRFQQFSLTTLASIVFPDGRPQP